MPFGSQKYLFKKDNYEVRRNTTDEQLNALWSAVGYVGGGIAISGEVNTFAELPDAITNAGEYYSVINTTGIIGFRKFSGLYRSDGSSWIYLGNPLTLAQDVGNIPSGGLVATDVQAALNELDSEIVSHVGSRGASHATSSTTEAGFMSALDHTKLGNIQAGATANSSDATLLSRANHTGFQPTSTITDFNSEVDARASTLISAHTGAADPHPGYLSAAEGDASYAPLSHNHTITNVTGLQPALDLKLNIGAEAASVNTINGRIVQGTNVTITGSGTAASPYTINAAGGGGSDPWTYVKLATTAINSTVTVADTALVFTPEANSFYEIEICLFMQAAATTTGARPGIKWPTAGVTQSSGCFYAPNSSTAYITRVWNGTGAQNAATTGIGVANVDQFAEGRFLMITGPSVTGNFIVTLASEIAASEARIRANSFIKYRKIL